jgi:DNA repair exonuclease SbcCD ATPase subunit
VDYTEYAEDIFDNHGAWEDMDIHELLTRTRDATKERLERELERIKGELDERETIHHSIVEDLKGKVDWYVNQLQALYTGFSVVDEDRSDRLKQEIRSFYQKLRDEQRDHWRDRQRLERERRDLIHQLEELDDDALKYLL